MNSSHIIIFIEESLILVLPLLGSIAFMTLAERKVMGSFNANKTLKKFRKILII